MTRKTDTEWRSQLTPEQYQVTRCKGTERPFTGEYHNCKDQGVIPVAVAVHRYFTRTINTTPAAAGPASYDQVSLQTSRLKPIAVTA